MRAVPITKPLNFLLFCVLLFTALYFGKAVLMPFTLAALLAMLFVPLAGNLERKGMNRLFSSVTCVLLLVMAVAGVIMLMRWQLSDLSADLGKAETFIRDAGERTREYISDTFGIGERQQNRMLKSGQGAAPGSAGKSLSTVVLSVFSLLVTIVLVLVYIFLFLFYRRHLKNFFLKLVPASDETETAGILKSAVKTTQKYLSGLAFMIVILWILYGIGFSIAGVKNPLFFAVLCGLLEIIPFAGNLVGTFLTILMSLIQGGSPTLLLGILLVYGTVQFTQTYLLEPLIVGSEVNINPLVTIFSIVVGEAVWGIGGMFLAIPVTGMLKILCDHIGALKPYGYLLGSGDKKKSSGAMDRLRKIFQ